MSSIFNYDILSNFRYADVFFYHPLDQRLEIDGKIDHNSSDIVANVLKMGEKRFKNMSHRKAKFRMMKFSTNPSMARHLANDD